MMVIETRQATKDKIFDLIEEMKSLGHEKKMIICELEETLYDCFESLEDDEDYENDEYMSKEDDVDFRKMYGRRRNEDDMDMRMNRRHPLHMRRRNKMGRFV